MRAAWVLGAIYNIISVEKLIEPQREIGKMYVLFGISDVTVENYEKFFSKRMWARFKLCNGLNEFDKTLYY